MRIGTGSGHDQVRKRRQCCPLQRAEVLNSRLFSDLVTDSLTEFAYDADLAGLTYSLSSQSLGLYVTLNGYNDKLHVLAKDVLERARNLKVQSDRLAVMKDQVSVLYSGVHVRGNTTMITGQTGIRELSAWLALPVVKLLHQIPVIRARVDSRRAPH